jgi:hypothetical protein
MPLSFMPSARLSFPNQPWQLKGATVYIGLGTLLLIIIIILLVT